MTRNKRILVAVDDSDAARRAVQHVGSVVRDSPHITIRLLHLAQPPVTVMQRSGTADVAEMRSVAQAGMVGSAAPIFKEATGALLAQGVRADAVEVECRADPDGVDVVRGCLDAAQGSGCDTIVVGRESLSRLAELFHTHASDVLVRESEGIAVWVVG